MKLVNILVIFVTLICTVCSTAVTQCKPAANSNPIPVTEVAFGDCVTPPCILKKGQKNWINLTFTSDDAHNKLTNNIMATLMGMKHGYPGVHGKNACPYIFNLPDLTPACPLQKGSTYLYAIELLVQNSFPKVTVPLHFAVKDEDSKSEIACFEATVKIQ